MKRYVCHLVTFVLFLLIASSMLIPVSDATDRQAIGVGFDDYCPWDEYGLDVTYYDDGTLALVTTVVDQPSHRYMFKDVRVIVCQNDHEDTRQRTQIAASTRVPLDPNMALVMFTEDVLDEGVYVIQIRDSVAGSLIVESKLLVGEIITVDLGPEGHVSQEQIKVVKGTEVSVSGTDLVFMYGDVIVGTVVPDPTEDVDGWYIGTDKIVSATELEEDVYIHVEWVPQAHTYTLIYDPNEGSGGPGTDSHESPESEYEFTVSGISPTRSGYQFMGWSDSGSAPVQYTAGSKITLTESSPTKTIKAVWAQLYTSTLSYDANGGSGAPPSQSNTSTSQSYTFTISSSMPTRSGYDFIGWADSPTGSVKYQPSGTVTVTGTKTIYAKWQQSPGPSPTYYDYSLRFDANGGSGAPLTQTYRGTELYHTFTIPSSEPTRSGYDFDGWSNGSGKYSPGSAITLRYTAPSVTLSAIWSKHTDVESITISVGSIEVPQGRYSKIDVTVVPESARSELVWSSSDPAVAVVSSDGTVSAVSEGYAVITVSSRDGTVSASVPIHVVGQSDEEKDTYPTDDGGSVVIHYDYKDGERTMANPIEVLIGSTGKVTEDQFDIIREAAETLDSLGVNPHIVISSEGSSILTMSELIELIVTYDGSLTIIENGVTLFFDADVLAGLGDIKDIEFCIVPQALSSDGGNIDVQDLDNASIYDIYILMNGQRIHTTFVHAVNVTVEYEMKEGWDPSNIIVYYLDVDPKEVVPHTYDEDGVHFDVMHFSLYAITYEEPEPTPGGDSDCLIWVIICIILILLIILIILFLLRRRVILDLGEGTVRNVPSGWKKVDDHTLTRSFWSKNEPKIPPIDVMVTGNKAIISWDLSSEDKGWTIRYKAQYGEAERIQPLE